MPIIGSFLSSVPVDVLVGSIATMWALAHGSENQPVVSSKTISAADRLHKEQRKDVALR